MDLQDRLKESLLALQKARARLEAFEAAKHEPIAIIGMGCRFPGGANSPEAFWKLLQNGVDAISDVPPNRWDVEAYFDADVDAAGKMMMRQGGFIQQPIDAFDAVFFGISPREARSLDPQQRMALEVGWEALEDAGIAPTSLEGSRTGVFMGVSNQDFLAMQANRIDLKAIDAYNATSSMLNGVPGRLSFTLGLRGPCMAVDTACSSSLVAVHLAVQSLRSGESDMALAGGAHFIGLPEFTLSLSKAHFFAPDGRCKAFDSRADGFVRAEGCGVVVLKRLSDAQATGDRIIAVIRGSAVNHGGASSGFTVPNKLAQQSLIQDALANAGLKPDQISYVEAHGTGTALGDPIEVRALVGALGEGRTAENPLRIGSVKTNVGHLEAAAGIIGLMKLALAIQNREIPPHLHLQELNPYIAWDEMPMSIPTVRTPWTERLVGGVSAFGASGVNAHAVLEAAPAPQARDGITRPQQIVTLSAGSEAALRNLAVRYIEHFNQHENVAPADVSFTTTTGRAHLPYRAVMVSADSEGLRDQLTALASEQARISYAAESAQPKVVFLFTGQGAQYPGMGQALYETQPVFRAALDQCADILRPYLEKPLLDVLFAGDETAALLNQTDYTQPALFALEYALAQMWLSWGVEPAAVIGHSVGEYVAACVAGVFSLEDGLKLIAERGRLMGGLPTGGAMAALLADEARVREAVSKRSQQVSVAAVNGPDNVVISGEQAALDAVIADLTAQDPSIKVRPLTVSHAFHSPLMDSILGAFERTARTVNYQTPRVPLISNVTGKALTHAPDAAYWRDHIRAAVQFKAGMETLHQMGHTVFLEVGPHPTLLGMGRACLPDEAGRWLPTLRRNQDEWKQVLTSLGELYTAGFAVDWAAFHSGYAGGKISLPTTPFERQRYWLPLDKPRSSGTTADHPLLGKRLQLAGRDVIYEAQFSAGSFLADHRVGDQAVVPAAAYIEMALSAWGRLPVIEDLIIRETLVLPEDAPVTVQVVITPQDEHHAEFKVYSQQGESWRLHAVGRLQTGAEAAPAVEPVSSLRERLTETLSHDEHYQRFAENGLPYGAQFQGVEDLWYSADQALGYVRLPDAADHPGYQVHPALLDACFQVVNPFMDGSYLPMSIDAVRVYQAVGAEVYCLVNRHSTGEGWLKVDVQILDADGHVAAAVNGLTLRRLHTASQIEGWLYEVTWQRQDLNADAREAGNWLIFAADEMGEQAAQLLRQRGGDVTVVYPGEPDFEALLETHRPDAVLYAWGDCQNALHLSQTLIRMGLEARLWLVTRGAQPVNAGDSLLPDAAPLWGFGRTLALEAPDLHPMLIDVDAWSSADRLVQVLLAGGDEDQVALRANERYVARLKRHRTPEAQPFRVAIPTSHVLDDLAFEPLERRTPGRGEIEIQVLATGLGFRDVLIALGMYPGEADVPGSECVGKVIAVGEGVDHLGRGDVVMGFAPGSFASHVVTLAQHVVLKPDGLSLVEAATIPAPFVTAYDALYRRARIKAGDRVLIHAAAGGVGLAAVQLALRAGAEVFGTAGSDEKRAYLKAIGVHHVLNSRSLDFADEILAITAGNGVDVVLNSLTDDFIDQSVRALGPNGRFIEIGRRGIWTTAQMESTRPDVDYQIIDASFVAEHPEQIGEMLEEIRELLDAGELAPLSVRVFPMAQVADAFRYMSQARHTGRIVVTQTVHDFPASIREDATYLISGGLGGIGLVTARWLVEQGARHLILVGRNAPTAEAQAVIAQMEAMQARITVAQADVTDLASMSVLFESIQPPLRGVLHCAAVLDDGVIIEQSWERFERVFAPKTTGAWNLHQLTQHLPLDFFILFSAGANWVGSAGQSNYVAANYFLDVLAHYRRAQGLPALAINWGLWQQVGVGTSSRVTEKFSAQGVRAFTPEQGISALDHLLRQPNLPAQIGVLHVDWQQARSSPFFSSLRTNANSVQAAKPVSDDFLARLEATPAALRHGLLVEQVRTLALRALGLEAAFALDPRQPLQTMGLDSLMAVELRNALNAALQLRLPATVVFDYPTVDALAGFVEKSLFQTQPVAAAAETANLFEDLDTLTDDEAEALLLEELNAIDESRKKGRSR